MMPRSGDLLRIGKAASVQFAADRGFPARVVRVLDWPCDAGYVWLDVYQLSPAGDAVDRRQIYVRVDGLRLLPTLGRTAPVTRPPGNRSGVTPRATGGAGHNAGSQPPQHRQASAPASDRTGQARGPSGR
jgi:hypothetical protein